MTTIEQLEKRLIALEKAVRELQELSSRAEKPALPEMTEEFIADSEPLIVFAPPAAETIRCEAIVKFVNEPASRGLGLSDAEWDSIRSLIELEEEKDANP